MGITAGLLFSCESCSVGLPSHDCRMNIRVAKIFGICHHFRDKGGGGEMLDYRTLIEITNKIALEVFRDYLICRTT